MAEQPRPNFYVTLRYGQKQIVTRPPGIPSYDALREGAKQIFKLSHFELFTMDGEYESLITSQDILAILIERSVLPKDSWVIYVRETHPPTAGWTGIFADKESRTPMPFAVPATKVIWGGQVPQPPQANELEQQKGFVFFARPQ